MTCKHDNEPTCSLCDQEDAEHDAAMAGDAEPGDLYWRLHRLSKSLESSGRVDEYENPDAYATVLDAMARLRSDGATWARCADHMPAPSESPTGYFWCWNEGRSDKPPELLQAYGYGDWVGPSAGFCDEASGRVDDVTHWAPAIRPTTPCVLPKHVAESGPLREP